MRVDKSDKVYRCKKCGSINSTYLQALKCCCYEEGYECPLCRKFYKTIEEANDCPEPHVVFSL